jgi:hypothetical protein
MERPNLPTIYTLFFLFSSGHRGYGSEEMLKLYIEKIKKSPHASTAESENTKTSDLNGETEIPSEESSPDLENMDSVFFVNDGTDELVDVSSLVSISEEEEELEHCGKNNRCCGDGADHCGTSDCQLDESCCSGGSQSKGDSDFIEESLSKGDSHSIEDSYVIEDSQAKGDSHSKGDSHEIEDFQPKDNFKLTGDSCFKEPHSMSDKGSSDNFYENTTLHPHGKSLDNNNKSLGYNFDQDKNCARELLEKTTDHITGHDNKVGSSEENTHTDLEDELSSDSENGTLFEVQEEYQQELHGLVLDTQTFPAKNAQYSSNEHISQGEESSRDKSKEVATNLRGLHSQSPDVMNENISNSDHEKVESADDIKNNLGTSNAGTGDSE